MLNAVRSNLFLSIALAGATILAASNASAQDQKLPACRVGMHAPIVSPLNYGGTILAIDAAKGSYQVKSDADGLVDWVPARSLRYSCVGGEAAAASENYFVGRWTLFIGPTAHYEVIDSKGYLVVGSGAHVPPLQVNADGTYTWVIDSRITINGKWRSLSASEMRSGTKPPAILLMNGEDGKNWQISRRGVNPSNNRDAIDINRMDIGLSYMGTRLQ